MAVNALYIIGEPGAGKSTLVDHLTRGLSYEASESIFPHRTYDCGVFEIGKRRSGGFSGTDALAMNAQPAVTQFLGGLKPRLLLAEGDRLANDKFFAALAGAGYTLHVVAILGEDRARMHRELRGSEQDETWIKGRRTKVMKLADKWGAQRINAGSRLDVMEALLTDEVATVLKSARLVPA